MVKFLLLCQFLLKIPLYPYQFRFSGLPAGRFFNSLWNQKSTCQNLFNCVFWQKFDGVTRSLNKCWNFRWIWLQFTSKSCRNAKKKEKMRMNFWISFNKLTHFTISLPKSPSFFKFEEKIIRIQGSTISTIGPVYRILYPFLRTKWDCDIINVPLEYIKDLRQFHGFHGIYLYVYLSLCTTPKLVSLVQFQPYTHFTTLNTLFSSLITYA